MQFLNLKAGGRYATRSQPKIVAIDHFTPHQLRHTYATLLYNAGVDAKSAQEMLGHASVQTTLEIYTHLSKEKKTSAISSFNAYLNGRENAQEKIMGQNWGSTSKIGESEHKAGNKKVPKFGTFLFGTSVDNGLN